jgi:[amino group carrier protein]-L-2-aminoadipate 6-kinase
MTIVVKVGGATGNGTDGVLNDIADRSDVVLVHGGSAEVDRLGEAMGRPSQYYTSPSGVVSRRSDAAHLEVVVLALAGKVQTELVAGLVRRGVRAIGLSGVDAGIVRARRKEGAREVRDGHVVRVTDDRSGSIDRVDGELLRALLRSGIVPVLGPPAVTADGEVVNVDADRLAARAAVALEAEALVLLTNVPGLLREPTDPSTKIDRVPRAELAAAVDLAQGRMRKKLVAAREALEGGVRPVVIGSSQGERPIERALGGEGTVLE